MHLLKALAHRLRRTNEALADLVFSDVPGRVAKALLDLATRFGETVDEGIRVAHDLTQEEIAQLVGASRRDARLLAIGAALEAELGLVGAEPTAIRA